jgi:RHS repeat-associated protein
LPDGTQIEYVVDGRNRRVGRKVNGVLTQGWLYQDQLKPIAELDGSGNVVASFVYATFDNVPDYMVKGGVTYRLLTDHLGSIRLVVDSTTGQVMQRIDYDAFGRVLSDTNPGFQPFGFAGGLYDSATGLIRFGARDYDAEVGRWTAKDPIGFQARQANLFAYAADNPINIKDSTGNWPDWRFGVRVVGILIGIGFGDEAPEENKPHVGVGEAIGVEPNEDEAKVQPTKPDSRNFLERHPIVCAAGAATVVTVAIVAAPVEAAGAAIGAAIVGVGEGGLLLWNLAN